MSSLKQKVLYIGQENMAHNNQEKNQIIEINSEMKEMVEFAGKDAKISIINMHLCSEREKKHEHVKKWKYKWNSQRRQIKRKAYWIRLLAQKIR